MTTKPGEDTPRLVRTRITDGKHSGFEVLRELEDPEVEQFRVADKIVRHFVDESLLHPVDAAVDEFEAAVMNQLQVMAGQPSRGPEFAPRTSTAFDAVLAAFRTYLDKTAGFVSAEFGRDSAEFAAHEVALSEEYDANAAYRAGHWLRNVSQHVATVLNDQSLSSEGDGTGKIVTKVGLRIDVDKLIATRSVETKASLREQIAGAGYQLHAVDLVREIAAACNRIQGSVAATCLPQLRAAVDFWRLLCDETDAQDEGTLCTAGSVSRSGEGDDARINLGMGRLLCGERLDRLQGFFGETARIAAPGSRTVTWSDLCSATDVRLEIDRRADA